MQIGINLAHHDHDYVEKRGGHVLWSHFRGAPARCSYRRAALQRAFELYERAVSQGAAPEATSGPALLVMQRALLPAEDLGRLLHSLHGMPSWQKLIAATLEDLDEVYREVVTSPDAALRTFILPDDSALAAEPRLTEPQRSGIRELRDRTRMRWQWQLETVSRFWLRHREIAKATMHGSPLIPGRLITDPPGAGTLTEHSRDPGRSPWSLAVLSRADHKRHTIETTCYPVVLDLEATRAVRRAGAVAIKLAEALCATQANSIASGHAYGTPLDLLERLSTDHQAAIRDALGRTGEEDDDAERAA